VPENVSFKCFNSKSSCFLVSTQFHNNPVRYVIVIIQNNLVQFLDYTIEERTVDDVAMNCRDYEVRYLAQRSPVLSDSDNEFNEEIKLKCKCSESLHTLDSNCRRLPSCKNNGFRAPNSPHQ
jgi:hypothetical protein